MLLVKVKINKRGGSNKGMADGLFWRKKIVAPLIFDTTEYFKKQISKFFHLEEKAEEVNYINQKKLNVFVYFYVVFLD